MMKPSPNHNMTAYVCWVCTVPSYLIAENLTNSLKHDACIRGVSRDTETNQVFFQVSSLI